MRGTRGGVVGGVGKGRKKQTKKGTFTLARGSQKERNGVKSNLKCRHASRSGGGVKDRGKSSEGRRREPADRKTRGGYILP